jgi:hypothetical protein
MGRGMNQISSLFFKTIAVALPLAALAACSSQDPSANEESEGVGAQELRGAYCPEPFTGSHHTDPKYSFPGARNAYHACGVTDGELYQTLGDAEASKGTHCQEPGTSTSAATDIAPTSNPCGRVHTLRMHGFAAFYRTAPEFAGNDHIHAVWAAASPMKASLKDQVAQFYKREMGLAQPKIEYHCPISQEEIDAVRAIAEGEPSGGGCKAGGAYCGGDKVQGDSSTLYRCNANGSASVIEHCAHGCSVNSGSDDSCKCTAGGAYCGGDVVEGDSSTLYRCRAGGSPEVIEHCARGCRVNSGSDDTCK